MRMLNDSPTVAVDASSPAPPPLVTPAAAAGTVEIHIDATINAGWLIAPLLCFICPIVLLWFVLNGDCTEAALPPPRPQPHAAAAAVTASTAGGPATDARLKKMGLKRIPVVVFEARPGASATDDCVICLGEFDDGDKVRVLPRCHHSFHVQCIDPWLATHPSCPTCRDRLLILKGRHAGDGDH